MTEHHDGEDPHDPGPAVHDPTWRRQARLLHDLAARLERGEPAIPTDVFEPLARELDLRNDDDAIRDAWSEQGEREAEPWVFVRGRVQG